MKPELQRIAIAEACGIQDPHWSADGLLTNKFRGWVGPDDHTGKLVDIPSYLTDLNAMYEAESMLKGNAEWNRFEEELTSIVRAETAHWPIHATAAQRAEAFLRTIGKWEESS